VSDPAKPAQRHAAALAELDQQIMDALTQPVTWRDPVAELEGRRNVISNHYPVPIQAPSGARYACAAHGYAWEDCPDWRDAAGQPEETPDA
jgi:hypothetical protein